MTMLIAVAMMLGIVYLSAIGLTIRDRIIPPSEYAPRVPRIYQHPNFRTLRWFVLPLLLLLLPLFAFALTMWFIVYLPDFVWRFASNIASQFLRRTR